jgi:hypothetical protein
MLAQNPYVVADIGALYRQGGSWSLVLPKSEFDPKLGLILHSRISLQFARRRFTVGYIWLVAIIRQEVGQVNTFLQRVAK